MILCPRGRPFFFWSRWLISAACCRVVPAAGQYNAPAAFIHPCQPTVATKPPSGPGWAHELKHDGYRLQIHVRDGRVRLYTMNGADWSKRYPLIIAEAARLKGSAILDAEVVCSDKDGVPDFGAIAQPLLRSGGGCLCIRPADAQWRRHATQTICRTQGSFSQSFCSARVTAFNTSNMRRDMATGCLPPSVTLGLRALFRKGWTHPIDRGRRKLDQGEKSERAGSHSGN